jgi:putative sterol carrier protein
MGVRFLSSDYMDAATATLGADDAFQAKVGTTELALQFEVDETPSGETITYYLQVGGGAATMQLGRLDTPDATIKSSLTTATAISRGDLNVQMALMTGKIKVDGSMAVLMLNQGLLMQWGSSMSHLEIDY